MASCGGPLMTVEVPFDHRTASKTTVPICKAPRSSVESGGEQGTISFTFVPRRPIVWEGYRDDPDTTRANQVMSGDIWEAGADSDVITLGVEFSGPDRPTMNTLVCAYPDKADSTEIAKGLTVLTHPSKPRR